MEAAALKMFMNLISGMTITESFSLVFIICVIIGLTIKGTLRFLDFFQKNKQIEQNTDAKHKHTITSGIDNDQMLLQFNIVREKLTAIEMKSFEHHFEMPKELKSELDRLAKMVDDQHDILQEGQKDILNMISSLEDSLSVLKEKFIAFEQQLPLLKSDSKDVMKEVNQNVQSIAKDIATLQGTILGNISTRNSR